MSLSLQLFRLQRKLANSEAQVIELAHLIRQLKEQNILLNHQLHDTHREFEFYHTCLDNLPPPDIYPVISSYYQYLSSTYNSRLEEVNPNASIAAELELDQQDRVTLEEQLADVTANNKSLQSSVAVLEQQLADAKRETQESASAHAVLLNKEKDSVHRLTITVQKSRMAEDALRAEINELTTELTEAQPYQQAYCALADEIGSLLTRNQIAEEEATNLSRLNAQILGHNNPAQRIMYVDRIRRELAEAKHNIAMLTRDQDALAAQNENLQNELDMYKSVTVPFADKPRTNLTRIARVPLVNLNIHADSSLDESM
ncbi:hypothetical protein K443DRAFT_131343 [Laccaria amethystina LaAM-08-1]|uniref:Hyaluronan-mediated motility receptor C-terminal domain-containing protein n=1 Tax=Laccaria amethystina LaAM-08-1 TaxID=1095629 RepID=A0A0C9XPP7_9AGAR|nr:hypothetical protein K443DRAFT_131343 [Laccaria amethystina LaAM-08-1]